jgi:hypothetical protein
MQKIILAAIAALNLTAVIVPVANAAVFHNGSTISGTQRPPGFNRLAPMADEVKRLAAAQKPVSPTRCKVTNATIWFQ